MRCEFPSFVRAAFQAQLDSFPHIPERLSSRAALAYTTRNHGTLRDDVSVLPGVEYYWQLHVLERVASVAATRKRLATSRKKGPPVGGPFYF